MLVEAGVDVIVVDTAHGHSQGVLDRVAAGEEALPAGAGDRRQHRDGRGREGARRPRRRRRQGRHRPRLDLHDAHRRRRRRAADLGDPVRARGRGGRGRPADRRRRHPLLRRRREGDRGRRVVRDAGQPVRGHRRIPWRDRAVPGSLVQELPRHGIARRDAAGQLGPLFPGARRARTRSPRPRSSCPRASRAACRTRARWSTSSTS